MKSVGLYRKLSYCAVVFICLLVRFNTLLFLALHATLNQHTVKPRVKTAMKTPSYQTVKPTLS